MRKLIAGVLALLMSSVPLVIAANNQDVGVSATVDPYLSITWNYNSASYGTLDVSSGAVTNQAATGNAGEYNVTVSANANYKLQANATDMTEVGGGTIVVGNMTVDSDAAHGSLSVGNGIALTASPQDVDNPITYTVTPHYHGFWLSAPQYQKAGSYTGTVTLTYASV